MGYISDLVRRWLFNRNRAIFRYWDGTRTRLADPIELYRRLMSHENFSPDDLKLMRLPEPALFNKLLPKVAAVVRDVFDIKRPENGGLTEQECIANLIDFMVYAAGQKKSTELKPTLPQSTATQPLNDSAPEKSTPADLLSTSTQTEQ